MRPPMRARSGALSTRTGPLTPPKQAVSATCKHLRTQHMQSLSGHRPNSMIWGDHVCCVDHATIFVDSH
jgi:hypothetical protein